MRIRCEERKKAELLAGQLNDITFAPKLLRSAIEDPVAELVDSPRAQRSSIRAPECRLNASVKFRDAKGLRDVIIGPKIEPAHDVPLLPTSREHDDRHGETTVVPQGAADFEAITPWQHHIEQNQVGRILVGLIDRAMAIARDTNLVAFRAKFVDQSTEQRGVILDNKQS